MCRKSHPFWGEAGGGVLRTGDNYPGFFLYTFDSGKNQTVLRAVIQRVSHASVQVDSEVTGQIGEGLLILLGVEEPDGDQDVEWLCSKIVNLRIFNDAEGIMNNSILNTGGDVLVVSQFTLHASTRKGNRPSYTRAAKPEVAQPLYERFVSRMEFLLGKKVKTGKFGAMMKVSLTNDGPVTIIIDTKNKE
jgi:D-tyrosyl-tRNA(Tyr) deacylase